MTSITSYLLDQFQHNPFFSAAVLAAPAAMVTYSLRALPRVMWHAAKRGVSVELRFNSDMDEYFRVQEYVMQRLVYTPLSRNFGYRYEQRHNPYGPSSVSDESKSYVSVGYGSHVGWWKGRPVWITRSLENSSNTERFKESLTVVILGRGVGAVQDFLSQLDAYIGEQTRGKTVYLYTNDFDHWQRLSTLQPRPMSTVITNHGQAESVLAHVQAFADSRQDYLSKGLPYHTGILLTGPAGTGKSSLIQALATETSRNLFYLNLAAVKEESHVPGLLSYTGGWENSILVIEDIDVSGASVDRENEGGLTLSTLLNMLDGLLSPVGMITVATSNAVDRLDPALIRAGRFDLTLCMEELELEGFRRMASLLEVEPGLALRLEKVYTPTSGAKLRALMTSAEPDALQKYFGLDAPVDAAA